MKKILGLDLGTNSIGWAIINKEDNSDQLINIEAAGSRIIPTDAAVLGDFDKGNSISQTAERTRMRGIRRLHERHLLRRERMHRILNLMEFLPAHYAQALDRYGHLLKGQEPKLAWRKNETGHWNFLFQEDFNAMLTEFREKHPELEEAKIPYDWTIYYLRKKALKEKVSKEALAWILLNFNQKRGYYQLRDEQEEEQKNKKVEFYALKVVSVEDSGEKKGKDTWYNVHLENGWIYRRSSSIPLNWVGKTKEFIVTTDLEKDGTPKKDKEGNIKRSFRAPKEDDWTLIKKKTEADIERTQKTVGTYIYETLLQKPCQKIRGKLVHTIERKYYKDELKQILLKQCEFHPELQDRNLYIACIEELYPTNTAHRNNIFNRDLVYLLMEDILFYQRPLKSKKSLIDNCPYEEHTCIDKETGEIKHFPIKCIAKSHPLFQEFRLWQFLSNLRIYKRGNVQDEDITHKLIKNDEEYTALFNWLNDRKEIDQKALLKYPLFKLKQKTADYRWNYVEDKSYPCNETRATILTRLEKAGIPKDFLTKEKEEALWHILYSVEDKQEIYKALEKFARKNELDQTFVNIFQKCPPFAKEYGAYSAKAIKRLLPLIRTGHYWQEQSIDKDTRERIDKIINGEYDENIRDRVRNKAIGLTDLCNFKGLPLWLASYIVYDRHSETKEIVKWNHPEDIDFYLNNFKQHSLRNPLVEKVITETLRTVRDIWKQVGHIDEIHVELGREMKNPADKRARMAQQMIENENANLRIKYLLTEFLNPDLGIENVRPYSLGQQDLLRIYEEGALNSVSEFPEEIDGILKKLNENDSTKRPSHSEIIKYKLWLEQHYCSPYTGRPIPLGKLFTPAYEIEHVIPQSRYFDDSLSNKVICESEVNKLKDNMLGHEFIEKHHGEKVTLSLGGETEILSVEAYEQQVKDTYGANRSKLKKLMLNDIPDEFIARQLNDSRYISKVVKTLLSNIVREENEQEVISKHVIPCTGGITDRLKKDWGINDVWNHIILPRFQRLNELTGTTSFTTQNLNGHEIPSMPLDLQKGFNKKRIDHRHHAMDAIIIACADRNIVNYLNNESASKKAALSRKDLQTLICEKVKTDDKGNYKWQIKKPWATFTQDTRATLEQIIVSFKQNLRIINKATNRYQHYKNEKKTLIRQIKGDNQAIRKPMHKDTVFGEVNLRKVKKVSLNEAIKNPQNIVEKEFRRQILTLLDLKYDAKKIKKYFEDEKDTWQDINLAKIDIYYFTQSTKDRFFATRKALDSSFDKKKIENITDTGIQKILLQYLNEKGGNPEVAFSPDGIDDMNRNIIRLNNGRPHLPIQKVRVYEKADKFPVGQTGNKASKFVEAAKGTNLFFAVYETVTWNEKTNQNIKKRSYITIPLNQAIERQKQGLTIASPNNGDDSKLLFVLSPNDLVYIPTQEELGSGKITIQQDRIYKMVSSSDCQCFFTKHTVANSIIDKKEFSSANKMERALTGEMIKEICIPIKVSRTGQIIKIG